MNVTFLIGNGFDIACGLKTSYPDFIRYYIAIPSKNENIELFKSIIRTDIETWADAELAFGHYTDRYKRETVSEFLECRDDFIKQLSDYLSIRESWVEDKEAIKEAVPSLLNGLTNFDDFLPDNSRDCLIDVYNLNPTDSLIERKINILTFNYTSLFEQILNNGISDTGLISFSKLPNGEQCKNSFEDFIYVHGKRSRPPVIFGVDDYFQISNSELFSIPKFTRSMLKPDLNKTLHRKQVERCINIINSSTIICIYGMSIGLTDTSWWKKIVEWLRSDVTHQLVYYAWVPSCIKDSAGAYLDTLDESRDQLFKKLFLSDEDSISLRYQIHIEVNVDLFGVSKTILPSLEDIVDLTTLPRSKTKFKVHS